MGGCGGPAGTDAFGQPQNDVSAGNASALAVGDLQAVSGDPVIIGRDSGGIYAMSSICTHAGCDMTQNGIIRPQGIFCGCHGSRFDSNGNPVSGPAPSPLPHLAVVVDSAGAITVRQSQEVDAATRVKA
jgi:Rieske Fe-S protein